MQNLPKFTVQHDTCLISDKVLTFLSDNELVQCTTLAALSIQPSVENVLTDNFARHKATKEKMGYEQSGRSCIKMCVQLTITTILFCFGGRKR